MNKLVSPTVDPPTTDEATTDTEPELEADAANEFAGRPIDPTQTGPPVMFDIYCTKRLPNVIDRWNKAIIRMRRSELRSASD
ncbi:MAG: hypothetical protein ABEH65_05145 [Halobacteriales archaeon]